MGDTRPRGWEAGESSRDAKTPRLEFLATTALEDRWEEWPEVTGDNDQCSHVPNDSARKVILDSSLLSDDAGHCADCHRSEEFPNTRILVCLDCGRHSCAELASYIPYGHAMAHAKQEQHWVAAMFADPQAGFCFKCVSEVVVYPEKEEMPGEIQTGGHGFGFDGHSGLGSGLLNLGDTWHGHEFGSSSVQGYAIRWIPNRGSTCYVNAIVQCLLVLDRLQETMLGPDAPSSHLGLALMELFLETSVADDVGGMLNPDKLLRSIRLHADKFKPYTMHDCYELLQYFRIALNREENEIETPNKQRGAPTVIDSIFSGELSYTRSCIRCGSSYASHDEIHDLTLALPSKEDPSRSAAAPQTSVSLKSQLNKAATQLIPANETTALEKIQSVAKTGDSDLGSELKDVAVEKIPEPLEVDSSEVQCIWQSKDVIQDPLQTREDKVPCSELSQGIIEAPPKSANVVPDNLCNVKVEQLIEMTTDSHSPEDMGPPPLVAPLSENGAPMASGSCVDQNDNADPGDIMNQLAVSVQAKENTSIVQFNAEDKANAQSRDVVYDKEVEVSNSIPSIEDCLSLFFTEQTVERNCDYCLKVLDEQSTNQSGNAEKIVASTTDNTAADGNQTEQSDRLADQTEESIEPNSLSVECKSFSDRQPDDSDANSEIIQTVEANAEGINSGMSYGDKETECHEGIQEAVSSCLPDVKQTNLLGTHHSENLSTSQLGGNQNEQKDRSGYAIETPRITKLPPVLTLHIKRYSKEGDHKIETHVSYKEYLDLGRFIDPRCWTADRLAKRGLPHPEWCLLCDQSEETIEHLLISCVFSRQVWYHILRRVGLQDLSPQPDDNSFDAWWARTNTGVDDQTKKGINSIIILGAWSIWNHRNRCVFDGLQPSLSSVLVLIENEIHMWGLAGARGISNLLALEPAIGSVDKDKSFYRLAGVVEHIGGPSMNSGHYVAYVRARRLENQQEQSSCSSSWFCADDSNIREATIEEVLKREAYILFYEKVEGYDMASTKI